MTGRDLTRLEQRLFPAQDGEAAVRHRSGIVNTVNMDGTVDLALGSTVVPSASVLAGAVVENGDVVQVLAWRGDLLVLGRWGLISPASQNPFTPVLVADTTNPDMGTDPTLFGFWAGQGRFVDVEFEIVFGADSDPGSGEYFIQLPTLLQPAATVGTAVGEVHLVDASDPSDPDLNRSWQLVVASASEPTLAIRGTGDSTSRITDDGVPWTWDDGDSLRGSARFRIGLPVPVGVPFVESIQTGTDPSNLASRVVALSAGTADKFVVIANNAGSGEAPAIPAGWTSVGLANTDNVKLRMFVKANTADTSVTVSITGGGGVDRCCWITGDIIGGDVLSAQSSGFQTNAANPNPPSLSLPVQTNWLGFALAMRVGDFPDLVYPANCPNNHSLVQIVATNQPRLALATGPFLNASAVDPDTFTTSGGSVVGYTATVAIPVAT